jgi:hypothetical protein
VKRLLSVGLSCACLLLVGSTSLRAAAPASDAASSFSVSEKTAVPGLTLQPGSYSIRMVDQMADRVIVRVDSASGGAHSTFIGLRDPALPKSGSTGQISWGKAPDGQKALRGFTFPGGTTVDFVYPKAEAVSLAKLNSSKVPAIDPASEGKVEAKNLSKDDMEVVTLWMLSSTQVGPNDDAPAIKAERFQQTASVAKKPVIAALPHTGSTMPIVWMVGVFSLLGAGVLRVKRTALSAN